MDQVRREPLADQAARLLFDRIRAGEWAVGEKLPGETTLGPQLGVGRSTVREAIRQLAGRGVLATRQGAGVFVTAVDVSEDWDAVLRRSDIVTVIEARIAIEVEAAFLAAERRTPADLGAMRDALALRSSTIEIDEHVDADMAFHRAIVAASGNSLLTDLFDGFTPRSRTAMIDMLRLRGTFGDDADHDVHAALLAAVADGDSEEAAKRSRAHLLAIKKWLSPSPAASPGRATSAATPARPAPRRSR
ncbi:GntR family transcriptional regulator [Actinoplanes sp. OR16]|uniref:FadR/GntR family transcriptional regulator n=1 Tax=Actinoplanes sp. OR16 TaxID=946334 RepID=UPI000F6BE9B2|nr:FCD domain-containing protein [Actinoplanes sp. OR16]BBH69849.1 GntR family transcriptional regulator [Actinoplanes sp. OR16]